MIKNISLIILVLISFCSCTSYKPYINKTKQNEEQIAENIKIKHSVFVLGNTYNCDKNSPLLETLKNHLSISSKNSSVLFTGNNINKAISNTKNKDAKSPEIIDQLDIFKDYNGNIFFIPGYFDWAKGKKEGVDDVRNQEVFIENHLKKGNIYLPNNACPGPVEIDLGNNIVIIIFDSQWWLHKENKLKNFDCQYDDFQNESDLKESILLRLKDLLAKNKDKHLIFACNHPLYSVGKHGGHMPFILNLFPLLEANKYLYLPLPGFIYTGYRKYLGESQDLIHPEYHEMKQALNKIFTDHKNMIYVAGHEKNLQYVNKDSIHHIISGAGSDVSHVAKNKKTDFAYAHTGFVKINFYENNDVALEFWVDDKDNKMGKMVFQKKLYALDSKPIESGEKEIILPDSITIEGISNIYSTGKFKKVMTGGNYRKEWAQKITVEVFDIGKEKGGLKILQRGGGQQTRSLRLEDKTGKQYVLRSVEKYVEKAMSGIFKNTMAQAVVQDKISASHPFSAITIPPLADAANVFHTNPRIVYVPDDPRFGIYRDFVAKGIFLFEERPTGNREDIESFGKSKDIVNTAKTLKKTQDKHSHRIDQSQVLRSRLFDLFINDWDRHDDQWRWATFKDKEKTIYQAIPRDRDQAYFVNEGFITWLISRKWGLRKIQGFDHNTKDIEGLSFNARYFDRTFLTEPSLEEWLNTALELKNSITDSIIEIAIKKLPEEIYKISGDEIIAKLKSRRDKLPYFAERLYLSLSKKVDIVGTNKKDCLDIVRLKNGDTKVSVYSSGKKIKRKELIYQRIFNKKETKEIRLYGLDNKDIFNISGKVKKGIKIRIIGGKGKDIINDSSKVRGLGHKTIVYDLKKNTSYEKSGETRLILSNNKNINNYNRKEFKYNLLVPLLYFGYSYDDGLFIGGGAAAKHFGFRKKPGSFQKLTANYSFRTYAYNFRYRGVFNNVAGKWNFRLEADVNAPKYTDNFFGISNKKVDSKFLDDSKYNIVRYNQIIVTPSMERIIKEKVKIQLGGFFHTTEVHESEGRYISDPATDVPKYIFERQSYTGPHAKLIFDSRNDSISPERGLLWNTEAKYFHALDNGENFSKIQSDLNLYLSFRKNARLVYAFRLGGAINTGNYEFYHANTLGGRTNLRGYRKTRFSGDKSLYQNTELRLKLFPFRTYAFNGHVGLIGFHDIGRVWVEGETSKKWHRGYGFGFWVNPFEFANISINFCFSEEERNQLLILSRFFF